MANYLSIDVVYEGVVDPVRVDHVVNEAVREAWAQPRIPMDDSDRGLTFEVPNRIPLTLSEQPDEPITDFGLAPPSRSRSAVFHYSPFDHRAIIAEYTKNVDGEASHVSISLKRGLAAEGYEQDAVIEALDRRLGDQTALLCRLSEEAEQHYGLAEDSLYYHMEECDAWTWMPPGVESWGSALGTSHLPFPYPQWDNPDFVVAYNRENALPRRERSRVVSHATSRDLLQVVRALRGLEGHTRCKVNNEGPPEISYVFDSLPADASVETLRSWLLGYMPKTMRLALGLTSLAGIAHVPPLLAERG